MHGAGTLSAAARGAQSCRDNHRHASIHAARSRLAAAAAAPLPPPPAATCRQRQQRCAVAAAARPAAAASEGDRRTSDQLQAGAKDDLEMWMERLERMKPSARSVALLQLLRVEQEGAYAGLVGGSPSGGGGANDGGELDQEDDDSDRRPLHARLDPSQARAVTELVGSVTRWRRRLDYALAPLVRGRGLEGLDAPVRVALRMALYELTELKNAGYGVIDSYVQLLKGAVHQGAANLANGVLRSAVRALEAGDLRQPPAPARGQPPQQVAEALAIGASHPTWMVAGWLQQYGPAATLALLKHNNARPRFSLRLSPGVDAGAFCERLAAQGVQASPSRFLPAEFVCVGDRGLQGLLREGLVARGEAGVQDEAAGLVVAMLDPQPGETVLDACAAPGGKALLAAARMRGRGLLLALDASRRRLASLRRAAEGREHGGVLRTRAADLRDFATQRFVPHAAPSEEERAAMERGGGGGGSDPERRHPWQYDRVLLDAPCSGTGVLSKRADLRWRRTPADVRQLAGLQGELLDAAAALVAPGGLLVYATCSLEHQENQAQVAAFLQRHPGFQLEAPPPSAGVPTQCLDARGCLAMLPHVHGTDGAFAARLRRRNSGGGEDKGGGGTETAA